MDNTEVDIKILRKLLNSKLFLNEFPMISRVFVDKYWLGIDVVLSIDSNHTKEYFARRDEIKDYIWDIKKSASVESNLNIYP